MFRPIANSRGNSLRTLQFLPDPLPLLLSPVFTVTWLRNRLPLRAPESQTTHTEPALVHAVQVRIIQSNRPMGPSTNCFARPHPKRHSRYRTLLIGSRVHKSAAVAKPPRCPRIGRRCIGNVAWWKISAGTCETWSTKLSKLDMLLEKKKKKKKKPTKTRQQKCPLQQSFDVEEDLMVRESGLEG